MTIAAIDLAQSFGLSETELLRLRKIIKSRGHFPNDEAAAKLLYLALRNLSQKWSMPPRDWKQAMSQFAILFEDRFRRAAV